MPHSPSRARGATLAPGRALPRLLRLHLPVLLLLFAGGAAQAQYVWIGPDGTRQYSDRPPPPGTPADKIVKAPGRATPAPAPGAALAPGDASPAANPADPALKAPTPKGPPTLAEQEAAYRERSKARQEQESQNQQEMQRQRQLAERCSAARSAQAQLASGARIARYDQDGQKRYLSDAERATQGAQVTQALQDCR